MAKFTIANLLNDLNYLRSVLKHYHIELQLIWLVEMLAYTYVLGLPNPENKDELNIQYLTVRDSYKATHPDLKDVIDALFDFRNNYAHKGPRAAFSYFTVLLSNKDKLNEIANIVDTELDYTKSIYNEITRHENVNLEEA